MLEFGKDLFDGVQVGRVFRQEDEMCAGLADGQTYCLAFVAAEIVQNDDVPGLQGGEENRFDVKQKAFAIDRAIDEPWRIDAIMAQRRQERHRVPVTVRRLGFQAFASRAPAAQGRHVCLRPGLVDKDQSARINAPLIFCPLTTPSLHVGTILFFGQKCFF